MAYLKMGKRMTAQRKAILEVVDEEDRPLSAQELHLLASKKVPKIGIATVYRAIRSLLKEEILRAIEIPGGQVCYEKAGKHGHHFHCRACDKVFGVDGCPPGLENLAPEGFEVEDHEIILFGRCDDC